MIRNIENYQRQVHLDFHTSPLINDTATQFNAREYAKCLKESFVNSVTVFAKCHHGMSYFPTKTGVQHPALKGRDILGEMIEALHEKDIRVPVYTTIAWEENVANTYPQWRQMKKDGCFACVETSADGITRQPAGWKFNDWLNPEYQDYIETHLKEILTKYEVDGLFLDIVFMHPQAGWSEAAIKFRERHNLLEDNLKNQVLFDAKAQGEFSEKFTKIIHSIKPGISVLYNTPNNLYISQNEGALHKAFNQTHFEIESLPSGFWGYYHFPRLARRLSHLGKPWLGMTGKFQKMWGDFGGLKPQAALEFECFRSQALGGGNIIGDQLHPRGKADKETYEMIGNVYKQVKWAEPIYTKSIAIPQIGILSPNFPGMDETETSKTEEGIILILEELHYDCAMIGEDADLKNFDLVILPDSVIVGDPLKKRLEDYMHEGGKLILSHKSGFDDAGNWQLLFLPLHHRGEVELYPNYWRISNELEGENLFGDRVFYQQGSNTKPGKNCRILVNRVLPYFKRSDLTYCSHFQTPPDKIDPDFPAVFGNDSFVYFADPLFREYRQSGSIFVRNVFQKVIERLIGKAPYGYGLSTQVLSVPRRKNNNLIITLLNYTPVRKALDIDVIENSCTFSGEIIFIPGAGNEVFCLNDNSILEVNSDGSYLLPKLKGRIILRVADFFLI